MNMNTKTVFSLLLLCLLCIPYTYAQKGRGRKPNKSFVPPIITPVAPDSTDNGNAPMGGQPDTVPAPAHNPYTDRDFMAKELQRTEDLAQTLHVRERADSMARLVLKQYTDSARAYTGQPLQLTHYKRYLHQLEIGEKTRRYWIVPYYFDRNAYYNIPENQASPQKMTLPGFLHFFEIRVDTETGETTLEKPNK